ncbi:Werner Syndrome-like exonuclease [Dioscorea cayenensis subsp. rotundata]|uniref:Werner Syndrome-like exonuclease n=1 Tax=Dioscorea cayennensis subsp. rotundata TaxID=55577 RepID=A0AB40CB00_DIOCR|nr:Werner Syndrome-like exonuclease [Dioscorea cayenensis subsp. rotundata]
MWAGTRRPTPPATTVHEIDFAGEVIVTTVTSSGSSTAVWLRSLTPSLRNLQTPIVGLDCEWRPNFTAGSSNLVATLQLCFSNQCLILQLQHMDSIPRILRDFLSDPSISFVGVGIMADVSKLFDDYDLQCGNPVDLDPLCWSYLGLDNRRSLGLKGYAKEILGLTMVKPRRVTLSNWESRVLSYAQIEYACIDACASYYLGCRLLSE